MSLYVVILNIESYIEAHKLFWHNLVNFNVILYDYNRDLDNGWNISRCLRPFRGPNVITSQVSIRSRNTKSRHLLYFYLIRKIYGFDCLQKRLRVGSWNSTLAIRNRLPVKPLIWFRYVDCLFLPPSHPYVPLYNSSA